VLGRCGQESTGPTDLVVCSRSYVLVGRAMEDLVRTEASDLQPRAPFSRCRMKDKTASTWPSATSSAAVRWP
jgi:hypothetical protein